MAVTLLSIVRRYDFTPTAVADLFPVWRTQVFPSGPLKPQVICTEHRAPFADEIARVGCGMIRGTVTAQGIPARARVAALAACAPHGVASTWSDAVTGRFTFYPLPLAKRYIVMGIDPKMRFDVDAHGMIEPVPWEEEE